MCQTSASGISSRIPSAIPSPARRIGTMPDDIPEHPHRRRAQRRRHLVFSRDQVGRGLVRQQDRQAPHQLTEFRRPGANVTQRRELVMDHRM